MRTPNDAIFDIIEERQAQDKKWGKQDHEPVVWLSILGEEFGELAEAINETVFNNGAEARARGGTINIRKEAVQVAAVAVAMIQCIDRHNI